MMIDAVQIGLTATRNIDGSFQPAVPLYIERTKATDASEQAIAEDITALFVQRMRKYIEETGMLGILDDDGDDGKDELNCR